MDTFDTDAPLGRPQAGRAGAARGASPTSRHLELSPEGGLRGAVRPHSQAGGGNQTLREQGRTPSSEGRTARRLARNRERKGGSSASFIVDEGGDPKLAAARHEVRKLDSDPSHAERVDFLQTVLSQYALVAEKLEVLDTEFTELNREVDKFSDTARVRRAHHNAHRCPKHSHRNAPQALSPQRTPLSQALELSS